MLKQTMVKLGSAAIPLLLAAIGQKNLLAKFAIECMGAPFVPIFSRFNALYAMDGKFHAYTPTGDFVVGAIYAGIICFGISKYQSRKKS